MSLDQYKEWNKNSYAENLNSLDNKIKNLNNSQRGFGLSIALGSGLIPELGLAKGITTVLKFVGIVGGTTYSWHNTDLSKEYVEYKNNLQSTKNTLGDVTLAKGSISFSLQCVTNSTDVDGHITKVSNYTITFDNGDNYKIDEQT